MDYPHIKLLLPATLLDCTTSELTSPKMSLLEDAGTLALFAY
jgi:hypothetical protein